jgi:tRNA A-37 threonylcarbamoyl transferase component Bud32
MTRADLYDWLKVHGCTTEPLPEHTRGNVVKIINPKTNRHTYLDTPLNETRINDYTICKICSQLGIEIPDDCKSMKPIHDFIKKKHYPDY